MALTRRRFLKSAAMVSGGALLLGRRAWAFAQSPTNIRKFVVSLPGIGTAGQNEIGQYLPLASKTTSNLFGIATDFYHVAAKQFSNIMHPDLPDTTRHYGYVDQTTNEQQYLGGVIVAKRGTPVLLTVSNNLPAKHLLPLDPTLMADVGGVRVGDLPDNRIATHLHGGFTPWFSDGTPLQWFTPGGKTGASFMNVPGVPTKPGVSNKYYPNDQSARLMWYHDHAMGITRSNAYAGLATGYLLIDDFEVGLVNSGLLPDLVGNPLIIQDKSYVSPMIRKMDPTWKWGGPGSLWYPHEYEVDVFADGTPNPKGRWEWGLTADPAATVTAALPPVSCVPEAFFDTIVINGGLYPKMSVPPRRVRFRILNAAQARFFHMNLYAEASTPGEADLSKPGPTIYQVGTEGGFLPQVVALPNGIPLMPDPQDPEVVNTNGPFNLLLAPAERADIVIDFNGVPAGSSFILYSDSPAPFPGGDPRYDYFTGCPDQTDAGGAPSTLAGFGPNTRTMMKFTVTSGSGDTLPTATWRNNLNAQLQGNFASGNQPALLYNNGTPWVPGPLPYAGPVHRMLTLNERFDDSGRLLQMLGTFTQNGLDSQGLPTWGRGYMDTPSETPTAGATEVWQIMNLTGDSHPVHFHLINAQVIQRQKFEGDPSDWHYTAPPTPPDANEMGWKETVRMNPGEVTTVTMKFTLPTLPTAAMRNAVSPRTGGKEYVWHCHILEHEEHDMMRPIVVL